MRRRQFHRWCGWGTGSLFASILLSQCQSSVPEQTRAIAPDPIMEPPPETELLIPTFLGNDQRRYYGQGIPEGLKLQQKFLLGTGKTRIGSEVKSWSGVGWTGQATLLKDQGDIYLVIGSYDHSLRKIRLSDLTEVWQYRFEDMVKGTATIYINANAEPENRVVIVQGSRMGLNRHLTSPIIPSLRAVSFRTGQDLWQMDIPLTKSYSRDHDGSPIYLPENHSLFTGAENGMGYFLDADARMTVQKQGLSQPTILGEVQLYDAKDPPRQGGNLVTESAAARWLDHLYVAAGSGHIYGISIPEKKIVWDFFVGTDLDGSVVISKDGKLFCTIEKEYNSGFGGVIKLDPARPAQESVDWFLPTGNARVATWLGGIIGSVAINDEYNSDGRRPRLFATLPLDGYLYIGSQHQVTAETVPGPRHEATYPTPVIGVRHPLVPSISTPIFTEGDRLIVAGYGGVYLFQLTYEPATASLENALVNDHGDYYRLAIQLIDHFNPSMSFEATPIVWDGKTYIGARDGYLYCLG